MKTILVDASKTFVIEGDGIYKPLYDLLETYPNRKIILSNASDDEIISYGLVNMPYEMFTLKHNPNKADPRYFETLLSNYNLLTSMVVYFDHNQKAINSAGSIGITSFFYDATKKDLGALKVFLDKNLQ